MPVRSGSDVVRLVRTLGRHRYLAGSSHFIHPAVLRAVPPRPELEAAQAWARGESSRLAATGPEPMWRGGDGELVAVLEAFWVDEGRADTGSRLAAELRALGFEPERAMPFDESLEAIMTPRLVDAGWEWLAVRELDVGHHAGARGALGGDEIVARLAAIEAAGLGETPLCELPLLGASELLGGVDGDGALAPGFVVWVDGPPEYVGYVVRGACRAAKLEG